MLTGKVAVVTGASRGIGAAVAKKLASMGADVAVVYAGRTEAAEEVCRDIVQNYGVKAVPYCCNVADFEAVKDLVAQIKKDLGPVYILVNNAGINRDGLLAMMKEKDFDDVIDVNLKGTFNMIRHCTKSFMLKKEGRIINISSVAGVIGNPGQTNYSASKAGIIGLTKSVARELARSKVTCNAIAPGFVATDMVKEMNTDTDQLIAGIPLGRMGTPEDIANAVAFLAEADYITGQVIHVDGGIAM